MASDAPLGFGPRGVFKSEQLRNERLTPRKPKGAISRSLVEASKRYQLFFPYLLPWMFPESPVEPLSEAYMETEKPTEHLYWELPRAAFSLGERGQDLGLPEHLVHGMPKQDWPVVENFVRSIMLSHAPLGIRAAIRVQYIKLFDPFTNLSRPIADLSKKCVSIAVFALESEGGAVYLRPGTTSSDFQSYFRVATDRCVFDPSVRTFVTTFLAGDEPTKVTEEKHGITDPTMGHSNGSSSASDPPAA